MCNLALGLIVLFVLYLIVYPLAESRRKRDLWEEYSREMMARRNDKLDKLTKLFTQEKHHGD